MAGTRRVPSPRSSLTYVTTWSARCGRANVSISVITTRARRSAGRRERPRPSSADELAIVAELQKRLFAERERALLVVLQAMDAVGKDGVIRSVMTGINPAGIRVAQLPGAQRRGARPRLPVAGPPQHARAGATIGVFNRSHYEDVLIVRVKHLVPKDRWRRRYHHIREFERMLVDEGTAIVKLFLHISEDEQRATAAGPHQQTGGTLEVPHQRPRGACPLGRLHGGVP